ncbi:MAG: anthrone oxygenase family protein [Pseudomonadota bacterium]
MQAINITVLNIGFLSVFIGTGAFGLAATVTLWITAGLPNAVMTLVASVIYLVGVIGVTGLGNVPLNESLAHQTDAAKTADEQWERYLVRWTRLNSLRATASLVAAALLVVAWPVGG